ncbi:MAG: hypothetical protein WKF77_17080 [Planctomycetaceae bacterium]
MHDSSAGLNGNGFTRTELLRYAWRHWLFVLWATWWGGLCFYAIVVIPIGTEVVGTVEQGFVTQQVTQWHNGLSIVFLICLGIEAYLRSSRTLWATGAALLVINIGLVAWHYRLTTMMDFQDQTVPSNFYSEHAVYLWITASEFFIGLTLPIWLFAQPRAVESRANQRDE